jgi:hypothetical protein
MERERERIFIPEDPEEPEVKPVEAADAAAGPEVAAAASVVGPVVVPFEEPVVVAAAVEAPVVTVVADSSEPVVPLVLVAEALVAAPVVAEEPVVEGGFGEPEKKFSFCEPSAFAARSVRKWSGWVVMQWCGVGLSHWE